MPKTDPKQEMYAVVESAEFKGFTYRNGKRAGQEGQMLKVKLAIRRAGKNYESGEDEVKTSRVRFTQFDSDNARAHDEYAKLSEMLQEGRHVHFEGHISLSTFFSDPDKGGNGEWFNWMEVNQTAFDFQYEEDAPEFDPPVPTEGIVKKYEQRWVKKTTEDGGEDIVPVLDLTLVHRWMQRNSRGAYDPIGTEYMMTFWYGEDLADSKNPERLHALLQALPNEGMGATIRVLGFPGVRKDDYNQTVDLQIREPEFDLTHGDIAKFYSELSAPQLAAATTTPIAAAAASDGTTSAGNDDDWWN